MSVTLKPHSVIKARLKLSPKSPNGALAFFTNSCYKAMDKYVPMDNGDLRTNVSVKPGVITYESVYAGYQYYGRRKDGTHVVKNYTTPGTGPYWDKRMWSVEKDKITEDVEKFIKRGGK